MHTVVRPMTGKITITDQPTRRELRSFWQTFQEDPTRVGAYLDSMAQTLEDFLAPCLRDEAHLWLVKREKTVIGAHWLHDCVPAQASGWMAGYLFPAERGTTGAHSLRLACAAASALGLRHVFCAVRLSNIPSQRFVEKAGWIAAGRQEAFGFFGGEIADVLVYSLRPDDHRLALAEAARRAAAQEALLAPA